MAFLEADRISMHIDGQPVTGFRSPDCNALWIRDHSDILRGGKYILEDVKSAIQCFVDSQAANGRIFDFVTTYPIRPDASPENWETWVRVPVEADVEYRLVKASYLAWQAAADDEWMLQLLPALERAVLYSMRSPLRWDSTHKLIKRPFTIDTWDFDYTAGRSAWLNFQIDSHTNWGLMHGDSSGFYEALVLLGRMFKVAGQYRKSARCMNLAHEVQERANTLLYNGTFYTHFYRLGTVEMNGFDDSSQLSLSNPMAINRGMATHEMARSILSEYQKRRTQTGAFAEWFSIDPPFPDGFFGEEKLKGGAYCNGGIMPLVGGELSRAAFEHGMENYGLSILEQYRAMIAEKNETYLWYFPDGTAPTAEQSTSPEATPTDGWGASAMLYAFIEGLCGIEDSDNGFGKVRCSPRWMVAGEDEATVELEYAASGASFKYEYAHDRGQRSIHLVFTASNAEVALNQMLPEGAHTTAIYWDDRERPGTLAEVDGRVYTQVYGEVNGTSEVTVYYAI